MKKINWQVRIRSPKFWMFLVGFFGTLAAAVLPRFGINVDLDGWTAWLDDVITIIFIGLTGLGLVVDGTTPGLKDSDQALGYKIKSKNEKLQSQVDSLTEQLSTMIADKTVPVETKEESK